MKDNQKSSQATQGPCSANTIPLQQAMSWAGAWRSAHPENMFRAFRIPIEDFLCLVSTAQDSGLNVVAIRAYMGIVPDQLIPPTYKLILLPVVADMEGKEHDVWELNDQSTVYDITTPCPSTCDFISPLLTGQIPPVES